MHKYAHAWWLAACAIKDHCTTVVHRVCLALHQVCPDVMRGLALGLLQRIRHGQSCVRSGLHCVPWRLDL